VVLLDNELRGEEVIRQPELAAVLVSKLETLPPRPGRQSRIQPMKEALAKAADLLAADKLPADQRKRNLQMLHDACASAVRVIMGSAKVTASPATSSTPSPTPPKP